MIQTGRFYIRVPAGRLEQLQSYATMQHEGMIETDHGGVLHLHALGSDGKRGEWVRSYAPGHWLSVEAQKGK